MPNESLMPDNVRLDDSVSPRPDRELVFITPAETPTVSAMATDMPSVPISFSTSPMALSPIFWTPATAWFRYASRLSARTYILDAGYGLVQIRQQTERADVIAEIYFVDRVVDLSDHAFAGQNYVRRHADSQNEYQYADNDSYNDIS